MIPLMSYIKPCQAGGGQPPPPVACPGGSPCPLGGPDPGLQGNADVLSGARSLAGSSFRGGSGPDSTEPWLHVFNMDHQPFSCLKETFRNCGVSQNNFAEKIIWEAGPKLNVSDILHFCPNVQNDGSNFLIGNYPFNEFITCTRKSCLTCKQYVKVPVVYGHTTDKKFACVPNGEELSCRSKNIVYLLSCNVCGMQYVGETSRELHCRYMEHVRTIKKNQLDTYLVKHFNQPGHSSDDLLVQILDIITDDFSKNHRETKELFWIKALVTAYPFGLNDKIIGYGNISNDLNPLNSNKHPYFMVKMPSTVHKRNRNKEKKKRANKSVNYQRAKNFSFCLINCFVTPKQIYKASCSIPKREWKLIFEKLIDTNNLTTEKVLTLKAISAMKFRKTLKSEHHLNKPTIKITVPFIDKAMDYINLNSFFKKIVFERDIISENKSSMSVQVVYKYETPIGLSIFNYNKTLRKLNNQDLKTVFLHSCDCHLSQFNYAPLNHVVTGDCEIVRDMRLQEILNNGTKFRLRKKCSHTELIDVCMQAFDKFFHLFKNKLFKFHRLRISTEEIDTVRNNFQSQVDQKIKAFLKNRPANDTDLTDILRRFARQDRWIITCADKASGNFVFTCKKFCISTLAKELGINVISGYALGNKTYHCITHQSSENIISTHQSFQANFGIKIPENEMILPCFYAIPKLHKNPYKFRFIVGAKKSSVKPISVLLQKILKLFRSHFLNYANKAKSYNSLNINWSINDSTQALNVVNKAIRKSGSNTLITADFSTMYTMLDHETIFKSIAYLMNMLFKNAGKQFVCVGYDQAFYSDNANFSGHVFDTNDILEIVNFVLDNTYFRFADHIFKQVCGVPMGGNASPFLADLTLSVLEFKYLNSSIPFAERLNLNSTCRYIDDILSINCPDFMKISEKIYPVTVPLEKTNHTESAGCYLDLDINFSTKNNLIKLFDKTNDFKFTVIKLVSETSNISSIVQYNIFYSQIFRFAKIFSNKNDFLAETADLFADFVFFGYNRKYLGKKLRKIYMNYPGLFLKYNIINRQDFMSQIYCKIII